MEEKMIERLTGTTLQDCVQGHSNLRLGAKTRKGILNVKKYVKNVFADEKNNVGAGSNCINYVDGCAIATDGHCVLYNAENYSEIYDYTRADYIVGDNYIGLMPRQVVKILEVTSATHYIEVDDMLAVVDELLEKYKKAKTDNPDLYRDMKDGISGFLYFQFSNGKAALSVSNCQVIKDYIGLCKKSGDCAIGVVPYQMAVLKIVGEGMMLLLNARYVVEDIESQETEITNIIKPINK